MQRTRLAKQKQLRRGCLLSRLRSAFTMPEEDRCVQSKISMRMIAASRQMTVPDDNAGKEWVPIRPSAEEAAENKHRARPTPEGALTLGDVRYR